MDFIKTIIKVTDVVSFKKSCISEQIGKVLMRTRMNTAFVIQPRTKPYYFLINLDNLDAADGYKIFNVLMQSGVWIEDANASYWLVSFYMTSNQHPWNDQRMYFYELNNDRFQTILDLPQLSSNNLTYVTTVAYYTASGDGLRFPLYRAGQNILTPINERTPFQRIQLYINNLVPLLVEDALGVSIWKSSSNTQSVTTTAPNGWTNWNNTQTTLYDANGNFPGVYMLFFINTPDGPYISLVCSGGPFYDTPATYRDYRAATIINGQGLLDLIADVDNRRFLGNTFLVVPPNGGNTTYRTITSGNNMLCDMLTYFGTLSNLNPMAIRFLPVKTGIGIVNYQANQPPTFAGFLETFATAGQYQSVELDERVQDNILNLKQYTTLHSDFETATTLIRMGTNNICTDLQLEEFGPFLRSEVYYFNALKYSPYVSIFIEGIGNAAWTNMVQNREFAYSNEVTLLGSTTDARYWSAGVKSPLLGYGVQTHISYTRFKDNEYKGDVFRFSPGITLDNKQVCPYWNRTGELGPLTTLKDVMGWKKMGKGYFQYQGYNKSLTYNIGAAEPYTSIVYLDTTDSRYNQCIYRMAIIKGADIAVGERLGVVISGNTIGYLRNMLPLNPGVRMNSMKPNKVYLWRIFVTPPPIGGFSIVGLAAGKIQDLADYGDMPVAMAYEFDFTAWTDNDFVITVDTQQTDLYEWQDDIVPMLAGPLITGLTAVNKSNPGAWNAAGYLWPSPINPGLTVDSTPAAQSIFRLVWAPTVNKGLQVGFMGRQYINRKFLDSQNPDVDMYTSIDCSWNETKAENGGLYATFAYTYGSYTPTDVSVLFRTLDFGIRYGPRATVRLRGTWDTASGRYLTVTRWGPIYPFTHTNLRFEYTGGSTTPGVTSAYPLFPPCVTDLSPQKYWPFETTFEPYMRFNGLATLNTFRYPTGTNKENIEDPLLPNQSRMWLGLVNSWNHPSPSTGTNYYELAISFKEPVKAGQSIVVVVCFFYNQTLNFDIHPPIDPPYWECYNCLKVEATNYNWNYVNPEEGWTLICNVIIPVQTQPVNTYRVGLYNPEANYMVGLNFRNAVFILNGREGGGTQIPVQSPPMWIQSNVNPLLPYPTAPIPPTSEWISDSEYDPRLMYTAIQNLRVAGNNRVLNIQFISGPRFGSTENRTIFLDCYVTNDRTPTYVTKAFTITLRAPFTILEPGKIYSYDLHAVPMNIPALSNWMFLRVRLTPKLPLYSTLPQEPFVVELSASDSGGAQSDYIRIATSPDASSFMLSETFRNIVASKKSISIRQLDLPVGLEYITVLKIVDLSRSLIKNGQTYYFIIATVTTSQTMPQTSIQVNFADFGWDNTKNWGWNIQLNQLFDIVDPPFPQWQDDISVTSDPNNSIFSGSENRIYLETPVTEVWDYYSRIFLRYPKQTRFWIEFDLALYGGKRDYIWEQFNHMCASAYKEGDFPKITNMMVLSDACDNKGYGNVRNFLLYNCYNGEERFFWQKFVKKTLAQFLITLSPLATSDFFDNFAKQEKVWDVNLNRYLTLYFK